MNERRAVCIGINDYPGTGNDLHGCVNDAHDWAAELTTRGYSTSVLTDADACYDNVVAALCEAVQNTGYRDRLVITYSGHGTYVPDNSGDEADHYDEAIVLHDFADNGFLIDDDLDRIFSERNYGARIVFVADSCFSGTVSRLVQPSSISTARFLDPAYLGIVNLPPKPRSPILRAENRVLLMSGCAEHEVSYDAFYAGRGNGAFTRAALDAFQDGLSYRAWMERVQRYVPYEEQHPQLVGSWTARNLWRALD